MADDFYTSPPDPGGALFRAFDDGTRLWPAGVAAFVTTLGTPDVLQVVTPTAGLPVQQQTGSTFAISDGGGSITVDGTVSISGTSGFNLAQYGGSAVGAANALHVQAGTGAVFPVSDNGGSITVDGPLTDAQLRASAVSVAQSGTWNIGTVTTLTGITNPVTVTGTVAATQDGNWSVSVSALPAGSVAATTAKTADFDTGAGTDNVMLTGIALPAPGGAVIGGTSSAPIRVDPTGTTTQPVSGTVAVSGGTIAVTGALTDAELRASAVPVSAASLPLPLGASTAAKQPALGTAGAASADVITVQGIAGMTAVKVDGSAVTQPISGTVAATQSGGWNVGQSGNWSVRTQDGAGNALTSATRGAEQALSVQIVDASGNQITSFGGGGGGTSATDDSAFTAGSGSGTPMMGFATSDTVDSGDVGVLAMTTARELKVSLTTALPAGTNNIGDVDVLSVPAPLSTTGGGTEATALRVTIASDSTGLISVDDNGGSLTVDGTVAATQSGTWNIGTVTTLTSITNPVTVSTHAVTQSGTWTVTGNKAEDSAAADGDSGLPILGVRNDAGAVRTSTDGDYGMLSLDSAGRVGICDLGGAISIDDGGNSLTVDNSGTFAVQAQQSGAWVVNGPFSEDDASTHGDQAFPIFGVRNDSAASRTSTDGDYSWIAVDAAGRVGVCDLGGSITVDGPLTDAQLRASAVSVAQSGTWNIGTVTTLTSITNPVAVTDNGGSLTVDGSITVTAAATSIGKAEDVASADADVGVPAMAVRKATPANTSGTDGDYEMLQMSAGRLWTSSVIDTALPAGSNAIGKLAANSGVDIGDVDVTSVIPGTGATNLGKAEDAAHSTGDVGVQVLAVRKATPANLSDADGDYEPFQVSAGRLWVNASNNGTFAVQIDGAALTSLQLLDDAIYTDDAAFTPGTSKIAGVGWQADETSADSVDEGDIGCPRMTLDRKIIVTTQPHTAGGETGYHLVSAATTNATVVKASPGKVYSLTLTSAAGTRFFKFVDKSSTPTAGGEAVKFSVGLFAASSSHENYTMTWPNGLEFTNGISFYTVTTMADSGSTAIGANDLSIEISYK